MTVKKLTNILIVKNVKNTVDFYCDELGFDIIVAVPEGTEDTVTDLSDGTEYAFASIKKGDSDFMIQSAASLISDHPALTDDCGDGCRSVLYFQMEDVESIFKRLQDRMQIVKGLHETFYGMREFYVKDADGYLLCFAQKA